MPEEYSDQNIFRAIVKRIREESREIKRESHHNAETKKTGIFHLKDLLNYHNEEFIRRAYLAVLGREPDPKGFDFFLELLIKGKASKIDIIGRLRYSEEGKRKRVHIPGLVWFCFIHRMMRLPILGYIVCLLISIFQLPFILQRIRMSESLARSIDRNFENRLLSSKHIVDLLETVSNQETAIKQQDFRTGILLREIRKISQHVVPSKQIENLVQTETMYFNQCFSSFMDNLRGSREDIKKRVSIYLPYLEKSGFNFDINPALDLGCGRGEWLELLKNRNINSLGVDQNPYMIELCRKMELHAIEGDIFSFLKAQPDNHFSWVTGFHIVEHFPFKKRLALFDEAFRVLIPGGGAIFETPNPENLLVGSCNFFLDPIHQTPIVPDTLLFLTEYCGFKDSSILRLNKRREPVYTHNNEFLDEIIYKMNMEQDFAVITYKPV